MTTSPSNLTDEDRRFLEQPRIGFITVATRPDEWPAPVPVWFEQVDEGVQLFSTRTSRKVRRIGSTPRASLMAANEVGEPENWVAITGPATVEPEGAQELAVRLAERYWDLGDPSVAKIVDGWRTDENLVRIVIQAEQVARYGE